MKTEGARTTSHPSLATLHQLFDGLPVDAAEARHARDCPSCAHHLQALTDQRTAIGRLLHRQADWVTAAHRQGRAVLADLLAELARACLARRGGAAIAAPDSPHAARSAPLSELPRPIESITADIRTLMTRLKGLAETAASSSRPASSRPASRAGAPRAVNWGALERLLRQPAKSAELPRDCALAVHELEGDTARWRELSRATGAIA